MNMNMPEYESMRDALIGFATLHKLRLLTIEMHRGEFRTILHHVWVCEDPQRSPNLLSVMYGVGATADESIECYARAISGKTLSNTYYSAEPSKFSKLQVPVFAAQLASPISVRSDKTGRERVKILQW